MALKSVWSYRLLFLGLSLVVIFFSLLPFGRDEGAWPGPDLITCLMIAWVLRRPDYLPVWLLLLVFLLADFLLMRPLGLWTLLMILVSENFRRRVDHAEALPFWPEVGMVAVVLTAVFTVEYVVLKLLLAQTPHVLEQGLKTLATIVFYPLVAISSQLIGVRRLAPGELDSLGTRA